ncbi:putative NASP-related protein sim3 [Xylogone sp. PMI_703]|nr:putative NASP-related protein sim3 [Xylogone sp. PMI_703]
MVEPSNQHEPSAEELISAQEEVNSVKVTLADLCARGTAQYAHKNYEEAADLYAQASELQAELNGEMNPENAEILFLYGRALFKVGQSKSDVLGGKVGGDSKKSNGSGKPSKAKRQEPEPESKKVLDVVAEEGAAIAEKENSGESKLEENNGVKKQLFQFTGDENFEDSDDDDVEDQEGAEAEEEEEEDDLASAFEVLDLARVLFTKRLEQPEEGEDKGKSAGDSPMTKHIKERLGDTHDLLAEISLENERFPGAVSDFRAALTYKNDLYPFESEIIAEAHYKLSLALEFASITRTKEEGEEPKDDAEEHVDQAMRDEAAKELEAALESTKAKLYNKEVELASTSSPDENDVTRSQITEVKEIVADMEGRLAELKASPVNLNLKEELYGGATSEGVLSGSTGESPTAANARIEEAKKTANDLTGLVRRKKNPKASESSTPEPSNEAGNGKRKAEDEGEDSDHAKKAKV